MNIKEIKCVTTANKCCKNYRALKIPVHSNKKNYISSKCKEHFFTSFSQYFSPTKTSFILWTGLCPPQIYTLKPFVVVV